MATIAATVEDSQAWCWKWNPVRMSRVRTAHRGEEMLTRVHPPVPEHTETRS